MQGNSLQNGGFEKDSKVIEFKDGRSSSYTVMIDRFDGTDSEHLSSSGYRGQYHQFSIMAPGEVHSHYDPRKLNRGLALINSDSELWDFLTGVHDGVISWEMFSHDEVLNPEDIEVMLHGSR